MRIGIFWKVITLFLLYILFSTLIILMIYHFTESPESISPDVRSALLKDSFLISSDISRIIQKDTKSDSHLAMLKNPSVKYFLEKTSKRIRFANLEGEILYDTVEGRMYGGNVINIDNISQVLSEGKLVEGGYTGWFRSTVEIFVPVKTRGEPIGILQVSYPKTSQKRVRSNLKYGIMVEVAIVSLLAFFFSRFITAPVTKLKTATKMVTEGNLGYQVNIRTNDEIGGLADDFNEMSMKLSDMTRQRMELTADISHELRSPLSRIKTASEMMSVDTEDPGQLDKYQKLISEEIGELDSLIEDLLELSKLELNKVKLNMEIVKPEEIVFEIAKRLTPFAAKKDIKLEVGTEGKMPAIKADIHRIRRAISNIVENSVKFAEEKGRVSVKLSVENNSVLISVSDDGAGVSEDELFSIFERFYRTDKSRTRETGGTGLGLAIAKSIVERHGGKITARKSALGGLEVVISLPVSV